jgi:hypothetical protein
MEEMKLQFRENSNSLTRTGLCNFIALVDNSFYLCAGSGRNLCGGRYKEKKYTNISFQSWSSFIP